MHGIYYGLCINCNGPISDERLLGIGICERCIENVEKIKNWKKIIKTLKDKNKLYLAEEFFSFRKKLKEFSLLFKKAVGQRMWSLQETWAKRILLNHNFSIVAPTGVGKTVLGAFSSLYLSTKGKKSYIIVPTALLVQQVEERIRKFSGNFGIKIKIVFYHSAMSNSERKEALEKIVKNDFDILITTEKFLINRFSIIEKIKFDFVFVDDIDSFLKSPKNIDKIIKLLGFSDEIISSAFKIIELKREANRLKRMDMNNAKILTEIENLRKRIEEYKNKNSIGLLVVSGATLKARRTKRIKLFEEILNFQLGYKPEFLRNVRDYYLTAEKIEEEILSIIKNFGSGCLIFVPSVIGKEGVIKISSFLNNNGIKAYAYMRPEEDVIKKFYNGEYDALIGIASFRSPLARGIDLPERIRYVIFAGVPRIEIRLSWDEYNPTKLLMLIKNLREFLEPELQEKASNLISILRKVVPIKKEVEERIKNAIENKTKLEGFEEYVKNIVIETRNFLKEAITPSVMESISKSKEISLRERNKEFFLIVADPIAYVQASGRASRLFAGGITRGASFLIVDDEKAFYSLKKQLEFMLSDFSPIKFSLKSAKRWFECIDKDRKIIKEINEGKVSKRIKDFIKTALLIVESPTKARTISKFFGKPYKRKIENITIFEVSIGEYLLNIVASMGHLYDLVLDEGFHGIKVENGKFIPIYDFIKKCKKCGEQFTGLDFCPKCKSREYYSKEDFIKAIRRIALEVNCIFIATDPDTEGEKIGYDLYCSLYPINKKIERLEFHEITKKAFIQAIKERRKINLKMVEAQLVRRIEDRWIGFELSRKLWYHFKDYRLSAGRVQTPVLGWIIDRVRESRKKKRILIAKLSNGSRVYIENPNLSHLFKEKLKGRIVELKNEEREIAPLPPYTTDTLIKDASSKLKFSASKTMMLAQDLFEVGLCTYHRTDSTTVSTFGINIAKEYIKEKYPSLFIPRRYFAKGAHECIRPTKPIDLERLKKLVSLGILRFSKRLSQEHFQLYDLIFKRFIASQMKNIKALYQKFKVVLNGNEVNMEIVVDIISEGFNVILPIKTFNKIEEGEYEVVFKKILLVPAAIPFTQGEIIALMREKVIGRPSTYARIISTILERRYAIEKNNRLINTKLGFKVYNYLSKNFKDYISEETTRRLESLMDLIEEGKANYSEILKDLYKEIIEIRKIF